MFAADTVAHGGIGLAALGHRHRYHFKNRVINGLEWIDVKNPLMQVDGYKLCLGIVTREAEHRLGKIVSSKAEEVCMLSDLVGDQTGSRKLDHGAHGNLELTPYSPST